MSSLQRLAGPLCSLKGSPTTEASHQGRVERARRAQNCCREQAMAKGPCFAVTAGSFHKEGAFPPAPDLDCRVGSGGEGEALGTQPARRHFSLSL